ncbi:MAG: hypothetical protein G01um10145_385 [Microgenomates group bacterium Gr01-1014_5]|nr:MAG: hypothetical protein G01um10145_385 [Microgenomates group bacterium Gr01-1014_5]
MGNQTLVLTIILPALGVSLIRNMSEDAKEKNLRTLFETAVNSDHKTAIAEIHMKAYPNWLAGYTNRASLILGYFDLTKTAGEFAKEEEEYIERNVERMLIELKEATEQGDSLINEEDKIRLLNNLNVLQRREETNG